MTNDAASDDDYHLRFQVADPELSAEQNRVHEEAMTFLQTALASGRSWAQASESLQVVDSALKQFILADYLKVLLAERHFQGGERIKGLAKELGVPMDLLISLKAAMIQEVKEASQRVYHLSQQQASEE